MKKPITGAPTILPGRGYSGLEKPAMGLFNMFKTWVKGLPKSMSTSDKVAIGAGTVVGNVLGYDDTHRQHLRNAMYVIDLELNKPVITIPEPDPPFALYDLFKPKQREFKMPSIPKLDVFNFRNKKLKKEENKK